jgi:cytochrome b subunit of formate dehydrogenase
MDVKHLPWSRIWAIISVISGVIAAVTAILHPYIAVIAGVVTSLTTLTSVFVGDYEAWLDAPINRPGNARIWSRREQEQFHRHAGGQERNPNFFEWFMGRRKSIPTKRKP